MPAALIAAGGSILGGLFQGRSAERAARTQADAQKAAAQIAAEEARFRPVGITTRFGQSQFQYGPDGRVTGARYNLSPEMRAYQDRLFGLAGQGLVQAEMAPQQLAPLTGAGASLFNLGQQYLAESPEQVAQKYMASQQDLLAPSRERQYAQLQNKLFQQGTSGLAIGATGARPGGGAGLGASNPELEAYYNAIAQQDAKLAEQAQQAGQQQLVFGTNLFGKGAQLYDLYGAGQVSALAPYRAYLGDVAGLESQAQGALDLGSALGGRIANPTGSNYLYQGGLAAANEMGKANAYNPFAEAMIMGSRNPAITNALGRMFSPSVTPSTAYMGGRGEYVPAGGFDEYAYNLA
jgi:hypothetical protein